MSRKEEKERLTPFDRFRERHERIDGLCDWLEEHWEDVVLYSLSAAIFVLITIFVLIMCSACNETTPPMYPTSRSLHVGKPPMYPTSRAPLVKLKKLEELKKLETYVLYDRKSLSSRMVVSSLTSERSGNFFNF